MPGYRTKSVERLFKAISLLDTPEECGSFLEDICTINEIVDMAQRLDTALLLDKGENYQAIAQEIGISTATISRVSRCINYGSGGYKTVIEKLKSENNE